MEVILIERVGRLGNIGDVVKVKNGYARNFLIPEKKAMRASNENKKRFEEQRHIIEEKNAKAKAEAEKQAKSLDGMTLTLVRQASQEGKLYGAVSVRDIAVELENGGNVVPKSQIVLSHNIKTTGVYPVRLMLHPDVSITINVTVVRVETENE